MNLDEPTRRERDDDPGDDVEARMLLARAQSRLLGWSPDPIRVGRYSVVRRIGEGGMGVVFLGHDDALDRAVALKLLRREAGRDTFDSGRLLREAQAAAKLSHPNVVHVYEVGREGDQVFMAMEYVDGQTLRRWRQSGERSVVEIVEMYVAAAAGLAAAHAHGLVHRDFKPDNVIVGVDGRPRVADFGLARVHDDVQSRDVTTRHHALSPAASSASMSDGEVSPEGVQSTRLAGTPAYMAPEQVEGAPLDARSDQFAFAVSLFEALFGQRPYAGTTRRSPVAGEGALLRDRASTQPQAPLTIVGPVEHLGDDLARCFRGLRAPDGAASWPRIGRRPAFARWAPDHKSRRHRLPLGGGPSG